MKTSRELISSLEKLVTQYEKTVEAANTSIRISAEQINLLQQENEKLREALSMEKKALELKQQETEQLRKDLAKATKRKNFFKKVSGASTSLLLAVGIVLLAR